MDCAGIYDRKYKQFYDDRNSGCTTAKKIWEATRKEGDALDLDANISCKCCKNYKTWKQNHPGDSHKLNERALIPFHYRVYPKK